MTMNDLITAENYQSFISPPPSNNAIATDYDFDVSNTARSLGEKTNANAKNSSNRNNSELLADVSEPSTSRYLHQISKKLLRK